MKYFPASIITAVFIALATIYSVVTPLGEGPDEPGHAAYVFFLAREGRLPDQRQNEVPGEGHQPPLAYVLAMPAVLWLPPEERVFDLPGNSRFVWAGGNEPNAVAHGSREYLPWREEVLAWHLARLGSVLCGAATIILTYLAAREVIGDQRLIRLSGSGQWTDSFGPILAAALVAFNPQFLFISGLISNDALLAALSAGLVWLVVRRPVADKRPTNGLWRATTIGVVLGLALLTKQSAVVLLPVALLGIASWQSNRGSWRIRLVAISLPSFIMLTSALVISGWWYGRNWQLYGDPLGLAAFQAEFTTQAFEVTRFAAWRSALVQLHHSFWARFGWMNVYPPAWVPWLFVGVELVAIVGLAVGRWRRPTTDNQRHVAPYPFTSGYWLLAILIVTTFGWLVSFALTAGLVAWQGRLLFPALPALSIGLSIGLNVWVKRVPAAAWLFVLVLAGVALWLPFGVIRPAYPFQTLPEKQALAQIRLPTYGRFAPAGELGVELRGWSINGQVQPGRTVDIELMWHALGRHNRDWTVFVHLVDGRDEIVAENNRQPRGGAFPMTQWVAGDWVADTLPLDIPASLASGTYTLRVGLFDEYGTQERTGVWDAQDTLIGDYLVLENIQVTR